MSRKAVLLHNGNILPSIPIAHSVHLKETYKNKEILMKAINTKTAIGSLVETSKL